ncbi:MAG: molybdopterin-dependent oxidoreductase [Candidatus Hydrothermae bacterium]|nr:molybdopterin-dependent oxidoreductase [Candidatus Hydrothermae bacterium]
MSEVTRRGFLKILGIGGVSLAGLGVACRPGQDNVERLISQLVPAENIIPGEAVWYATTCTECPAGCGLLLKVREGRVIKVEGNPDHPVSQGRHCMRGEAALQGLYNPDRLRAPLLRKNGTLVEVSWDEALQVLQQRLEAIPGHQTAWMTPPLSGALGRLMGRLIQRWGGQWVPYEPFHHAPLLRAVDRLFGRRESPVFDLEQADLVVSFGADFLDTWDAPVQWTRIYASRRVDPANRLAHIQIEPRLSLTGNRADLWIPVREGAEALVIGHLLYRLVEGRGDVPAPIRSFAQNFRSVNLDAAGVSAEEFERLEQALRQAKRPLVLGTGWTGAGWPRKRSPTRRSCITFHPWASSPVCR